MRSSPPCTDWRRPFITVDHLDAALSQCETPDGFQASSQHRFKDAIFGRDSLEVGLDLLPARPATVERILFSVARHIGRIDDPASEEEPGKGFHEHRSRVMGGREVGEEQLAMLHQLAQLWGSDPDHLTYFGAIDTGALYLVLLERYVRQCGDSILDAELVHARTGEHLTIGQTVTMSAEFYRDRVEGSPLHLVEFQHRNPQGWWYQVMRDGHDSMTLPDGTLANPHAPIAAIEVQSIAHAALRSAARLIDDPGLQRAWRRAADAVRDATFERMWDPDLRCFVRAIHRRADGAPEAIRIVDSAAFELLRDELFDDLAPGERASYVGALVDHIFSDEFLVEVGVRMRPRALSRIADYWQYQGANAVWPTVVKRIADGLHRQGLHQLGDDMDRRLLFGCETVRDLPEYFYVTDDGTPIFRIVTDLRDERAPIAAHPAPSVPQTIQAWTASAAFGSLTRPAPSEQALGRAGEPEGWTGDLTDAVLERIWAPYTARIDVEEGHRREQRFYLAHAGELPASVQLDA